MHCSAIGGKKNEEKNERKKNELSFPKIKLIYVVKSS